MKRFILKGQFLLILFSAWALLICNAQGQQNTQFGQKTGVKVQEGQNSLISADSSNIAIGYGLLRSANELTGAVGMINGTDLSRKNVINPANALYGQTAGLQVLQNAGEPPTAPTLFIRGRGTFRNSAPLVLVDGFQQPFGALAPDEIESISVLKDAATLAMYGQRGANGVILITTKRGDAHSLKVNASVEEGLTQPREFPNFLQAATYARATNEALANDGLSSRYSSQAIQAYENGNSPYLYPNVDWGDEVTRNFGTRSNYNVTFRGGGETARYFALINYARDTGIYANTNADQDYDTQLKHGKFNFRTNLDVNITNNLLFKVDFAGNLVENKAPGSAGSSSQIFNGVYSIPSAAFPVKTPDGHWGGTPIYGNNPMAILSSTGVGRPNEREVSLTGTLHQNLSGLTKGLSVEASVRYNNYNRFTEGQSKNYSYEYYAPTIDNNGSITDTTIAQYGQDTDLNFSGGLNSQRTQFDVLGKVNLNRNFGNSSIKSTVFFHQFSRSLKGQGNTYHRRNIAANIHYGYLEKYFADITASYSGFSVLPPNHRYGFFPAVSVGWLMSDEQFMSDISFLNKLKLRASWGLSGNGSDGFPNTDIYQSSFDYGSGYWFQNGNNSTGGFEEVRLASPNFTYAKSEMANLGIDARLFQKLRLSADVFYEHRTHILTGAGGNYSELLGIGVPLISNGIVNNKGVEATLNWQDKIGTIRYHIGGNISFTNNEIDNNNEQYRPYDYQRRTGRQVGQFFGLQSIGFFKDQNDIDNSPTQKFGDVQPGDVKYKDQNNDGVINEYDELPLGNAQGYPEIYYAFSLGINYKGFGISAQFQGTGNQSAFLNTESVYWPLRNNNNISEYYYKRRWTSQNASSASLPRLTTENNDNNYRASSLWLADRSYLKLRNLEVSYSFPSSLIKGWSMKNVIIYLNGRNLFSIDNIPIMDPENLATGYPLLRSYQLGLEVKF